MTANPWVPRASCGDACLAVGTDPVGHRVAVAWRLTCRTTALAVLLPGLPLLAVTLLMGPGGPVLQRGYCRLVLRALGVRVRVSGGVVRNLRGVLVAGNHVSWADVFVVGAVLPGTFVAKAEMVEWPGLGRLARWLQEEVCPFLSKASTSSYILKPFLPCLLKDFTSATGSSTSPSLMVNSLL